MTSRVAAAWSAVTARRRALGFALVGVLVLVAGYLATRRRRSAPELVVLPTPVPAPARRVEAPTGEPAAVPETADAEPGQPAAPAAAGHTWVRVAVVAAALVAFLAISLVAKQRL